MIGFIVLLATGVFADQDVSLHGDARIHFATVQEGVAVLTKRDRFTKFLSRQDSVPLDSE